MRFAITGVTLTGNMGGSAMLHAALQQLRARFPGARFQLLSIYPEADRRCNREPDLEVVRAAPVPLLAWYMPLTLLAMLGEGIRRFLARRIAFFRAVEAADALVDLSGIAFVDGRGFPLLWYNLSCALPGIVWRKPVFKLAQALGPFRTPLNRTLARPLLGACAAVVARGEQSRRFLEELGMRDARALPDVSFALDVPQAARLRAEQVFRGLAGDTRPWVVVSPSKVVAQLCEKQGIDFLPQMAAFVGNVLREHDVNVLILPHSLGRGRSKNNDIDLCRALHERLAGSPRVFLHVPEEDPVLLRALIGRATLFVGCRFHAVVAALIMGVPTLILGWSHKYREMADAFEADIPSFDFTAFSSDWLTQAFREAWQASESTRARLAASGPRVAAEAIRNFDLVETLMKEPRARQ